MADCLVSCHTPVPLKMLDVLCGAVPCCAVLGCAVLACSFVYVRCRLALGLHMYNLTVCWGQQL